MGGSGSSRHISFDPADEDGVAFVKGIRLSERVIDRMKVPPPEVLPQATTKSSATVAPPVERLVSGELHVPIIPHPPSYASTLVPPPLSEPVTPFVPLVPVTEETSSPVKPPEGLLTPPPTGDEPVAIPPSTSTDPLTEPVTSLESSVELLIPPAEPIEPVETLSSCNLAAQPTDGKPMDLPVDPETSPSPISISAPIPSVLEESAVSYGSASSVVLPDEMPSKTQMGPNSTGEPQVVESVAPSFIDQLEVFPPQTHVVDEEKFRKQIREDFQKLLKEEMKMAERNIRQQLEKEKAKAKAQAQAAARLQIQDEVQKLLEEEKVSYRQTLADAIRSEQLNVQDEHLITQYYWMERKDALFRKQIAKMQEKIKPVCSDLQSQILKCYAANKGQTMSCSNIASLYIQCVDRAKQLNHTNKDKKLSTGG